MASIKEQVQTQIAANKVIVYAKSYCPYCAKTKALLTELGVNFEAVELDLIEHGEEIQDVLEELTGQSTVPNTFVGGTSIGGNSQLQKLHKKGELVPKLQEVGALA